MFFAKATYKRFKMLKKNQELFLKRALERVVIG